MTKPTIEPVVFGATTTPLFGMLTRPVPGRGIDRGVVVCAPIGFENVVYYRQLGLLARRFAQSGRPALRFDWPGCGDSGGGDRNPDLVASWIASVGLAAGTLRELTGVTEVDIVGLRLGATLAAAAASATDVSDLVLWAPFKSGRDYVREMRAFHRMAERPADESRRLPEEEGQEASGFLLSAGTIEALREIDLLSVPIAAPGRRILLAGRDEPPDETIARRFRDEGVAVDTRVLAGLREVALGWTERPVPTEAFEAIASWLAPGSPLAPTDGRPRVQTATMVDVHGTSVAENAFVLGGEEPIFGIVARPGDADPDHASSDGTWVVFLPNRYARRIGPNRFYTRWAREWAAAGVPSLRVDTSGTGDAGGPDEETDRDMYAQPALDDTRRALAYLREHHDAQRFALIGLCSGAYMAFHAALEEPDVDCAVMLNPQMLLWTEHETAVTRAGVLTGRMFRWASWRRLLRNRGQLLRYVFPVIASSLVAATRWRALRLYRRLRRAPEPNPIQTWIATALDRIGAHGCSLVFVYSQGDAGITYLERHLGIGLGNLAGRRGVKLEIVEGADHTFRAFWAQDALEALIETDLEAAGFPVQARRQVA
jgi:pimeloyl-ACP methyl ester carboxylesterase